MQTHSINVSKVSSCSALEVFIEVSNMCLYILLLCNMLPIIIPKLVDTIGSLPFFDGCMEVSNAFIPKVEPGDPKFPVEGNPINLQCLNDWRVLLSLEIRVLSFGSN